MSRPARHQGRRPGKGRTTRERLDRNFGQMNPEGYRKALRVFQMAEKFGHPVISIIDTQGAAPGIGAEERGQAEAIANNLKVLSVLRVPIVCIVIGEGGSGGALGIGVGDRILMLENAYYSVITPEGCAAILWKDQAAVQQAAENLRLQAQDLLGLGLIDQIIPEPAGGAHMDYETTFRTLDKHLQPALKKLERKFRLVALSNGEPAYLDHLVTNRIRHGFDQVISVETVGAFKPHPGVYRRAAMMLGLEVGECLMVSANSFDVVGARAAGFKGAYVNRYGLPYEDTPFRPQLTAGNFTELAQALL